MCLRAFNFGRDLNPSKVPVTCSPVGRRTGPCCIPFKDKRRDVTRLETVLCGRYTFILLLLLFDFFFFFF